MRNNFRQGLISYQKDINGAPQFLLASQTPGYVQLNVAPNPTTVTFAHGGSDYLATFAETQPTAWGPLVAGQDNYLYWDMDQLTSNVSTGITTLEPYISTTAPDSPADGQHWFDRTTNKLKVWQQISNRWIEKVRVFAGKVTSGNVNSIIPRGIGSQVGLTEPANPGYVLLDEQLRPLRTSTGEFLTADTPIRVRTTVGTSGVLSTAPQVFVPVRAGENLPAMSVVYFSGEDTVSLASSDPAILFQKTPVGIVQQALAQNEVGSMTQAGEITYDQWDWSASIGKAVYVNSLGQLTTTRPNGLISYRVGFVKNKRTIIFAIDAETEPQVYTATGNELIVAGTTPIQASTVTNQIGEKVATISILPATSTAPGALSAEQFTQITLIDGKFQLVNDELLILEETKSDVGHHHVPAEIDGLQALLDAKMAADKNFDDRYSLLGHNHDERYSLLGHTHVMADVSGLLPALDAKLSRTAGKLSFADIYETVDHTGPIDLGTGQSLVDALNSKASATHTHIIEDVTGLVDALNERAYINHTHSIAQVNGLQQALDSLAADIAGVPRPPFLISDITGLQAALDGIPRPPFAIADITDLQLMLDELQNQGPSVTNLDDLEDVDAPSPVVGEVLYFGGDGWTTHELMKVRVPNGNEFDDVLPLTIEFRGMTVTANGEDIVVEGGAGVSFLRDLEDVFMEGTPGDGNVLAWNVDRWEPHRFDLGDLGDVDLSGNYNDGDVLTFEGGTWKPLPAGGEGGGGSGNAAGPVGAVQIGDGFGHFDFVPPNTAGRVLTSNGDQAPTWEEPEIGGTVSSIVFDTGETGLQISGGEGDNGNLITTAGTLLLGGKLSVLYGGTGGTSVAEAQANLLPDQVNHTGAALTTDGAGNLSWVVAPGSAYTAGVGLQLDGTVFNSRIVNTARINALQISNADGTLTGLESQEPNQVLISTGPDSPPTWSSAFGTVTHIGIVNNADVGLIISGGDPEPEGNASITTSGTISLAGVLKKDNGGTGATGETFNATIQAAAFPSLVGTQGMYLKSNGPPVGNGGGGLTWGVPAGGGTILSVNVTGGETGLEFAGGPVTEVGTMTMTGALNVSHGGTGVTSGDALSALISSRAVPPQSGEDGKFLKTNGVETSWAIPAGGGTVISVNVDGGETGFGFQGGPVTEEGTFTMTGALNIAHGGTGVNSGELFQALIRDKAFPPIGGQANKFLTTNGVDGISWGVPAGGGTVQSVDVSGGETGLHFSGGPITTTGAMTMSGVLSRDAGGTGTGDADAFKELIIDNAFPSMAGKAGKYLRTDGTATEWDSFSVNAIQSILPGTTGFTFDEGQTDELVLNGTLSVLHGGTGKTAAVDAFNNLAPSQAGFAGRFLGTDGVAVGWMVPPSAGTVTSVNITGGETGITFSGGPITSSGSFSFGGVLATANGGTGTADPAEALATFLPNQSGQVGKVLATDGTSASWTSIAAGTVTSVQVATNLQGLAFTGGPVTSTGTILLGGVLGLANGGTGGTNQAEALLAILPTQGANAGKALVTNGTTATWQTVSSTGTVTSVDISTGSTGLTATGGPITSSGSITLGGTLAPTNGGTGTTTLAAALTALLPSQSGQTGKVLSTNGTVPSWIAGSSGTVTSVAMSGGTTGLTFTGGPITATGTFTAAGTLAIANGGTGAVSATAAILALLPSQSGASGLSLVSNGTTAAWTQTGYLVLPRTTTFDATAKGKRVAVTAGFTIPAATYAAGDCFSFYNDSGAAITITQGSGLTLRQDGTANTGNRTLAQRGSCFVWFNSASEAIINGSIT